MNSGLIALWNSKVKDGDTIWLLGDFGFHHSEAEDLYKIFQSLKGHKKLVVGNHDEKNAQVLRLPWDDVQKIATHKENRRTAELCHYPLETWKKSHAGALMLHGHCHGSLKRQLAHRFDVGVDTRIGAQGPILWEDLLALASKQTFQPTDAHGDTVREDL